MSRTESDAESDSWLIIDPLKPFDLSESHHSHSLDKLLVSSGSKSCSEHSDTRTSLRSIHGSSSPPLSMFSGSSGDMYTRPKIEVPHDQIVDFIWDWSSRPEVMPPLEYEMMLKQSVTARSDDDPSREQQVDDSWYTVKSLTKLLLSHACSFIVGAALMVVYFKSRSATPKSLRL